MVVMKEFWSMTVIGSLIFVLFGAASVFAAVEEGFYGFADNPNIPLMAEKATSTPTTTNDVSASATAASIINQRNLAADNDITRPEELTDKVAIITLFESRPVTELGAFNLVAFGVQESVRQGVPANTIFLIILTPILALLVSLVRVVIGLPTLDMLVPIALSFALVAVGISVGLLVLLAILFASYVSKRMLSKVRIMFYPKRALSMVLLSLSVFAALSVGVAFGFERILSVSIFPILILMLLGDMIVSVQLHKSASETFTITSTTIIVALIGYVLATSGTVQNTLILYPELVLLVIPANLLIGRYFGLRVLEFVRFSKVTLD
jgi:membrane-associated HD superfamily phosphohydrolase